jgi:phosphatidylinositol-3-phosphatase
MTIDQEVPVRKTLLCLAAITLATLGPAAGAAAISPAAAASGPCGTAATPSTYRHVIWIWMENNSYSAIIGSSQAPYINSLARECGLATNYHNVSHPSLPNYLGATAGLAGSQLPYLSYTDCNVSWACNTSATSIFGQGETWKAYEESMPSNCDKSDSGEYAVRHNPPPYFTSLANCATDDVPYSHLAPDLAANALPAFSFITPNLIDDMHDSTIATGDTWLANNLPTILNSPEYQAGNTAVFITWDEGSGGYPIEDCDSNTSDGSCHVATIVISPSTPAGTTSSTFFNHYSLLGTTEQMLGLPKLDQAANSATMTAAFHL